MVLYYVSLNNPIIFIHINSRDYGVIKLLVKYIQRKISTSVSRLHEFSHDVLTCILDNRDSWFRSSAVNIVHDWIYLKVFVFQNSISIL